MSHTHQRLYLGSALPLVCLFGSTSLWAAAILPSPANDILLASNGGVADINGSTVDGGGQNYQYLAPANLNDGDRDGDYHNGGGVNGVDGWGSLAHTLSNAGGEMGVTMPTPTFIQTVDLFNRTDCCDYRIDNFGNTAFTLNVYNGATLVFTNTYKFVPTISEIAGNGDTDSGMVFPVGKTGTRVEVVQNNTGDYMNLAELEAYTPEPASLAVFGLGALGLLARRR